MAGFGGSRTRWRTCDVLLEGYLLNNHSAVQSQWQRAWHCSRCWHAAGIAARKRDRNASVSVPLLPLPAFDSAAQEFAMGMSILAFLVILKQVSKRVKKVHWLGAMGPILACAIGIAAVAAGGLNKKGIKIVEKIPHGECHCGNGWLCIHTYDVVQLHVMLAT